MPTVYLLLLLAVLALIVMLLHATGVLRRKARRSLASKAISPINRASTVQSTARDAPIDYPLSARKDK